MVPCLRFSVFFWLVLLIQFRNFRCSIWLAVDVWMCTASILHLVVISLDRYIAVTHPITYPNLMTSKKAKLLICGAWILSFVICFPPLVGWNDKDEDYVDEIFDQNKTRSKLKVWNFTEWNTVKRSVKSSNDKDTTFDPSVNHVDRFRLRMYLPFW